MSRWAPRPGWPGRGRCGAGWCSSSDADASAVSWRTPVLVLLPGAAVGGLLGWAAGLRAAGRRPPRVLVLAPGLFAVALLDPEIARSLVTDGQGSGALIVVVTARGRRPCPLASRVVACPGRERDARRAGRGDDDRHGCDGRTAHLAPGAAAAALGVSLMAALCVASTRPTPRTHAAAHRATGRHDVLTRPSPCPIPARTVGGMGQDGGMTPTTRLDPESCYRAVKARDRRFDGVFYTAVRTTGIYCRPSCPARTPALRQRHASTRARPRPRPPATAPASAACPTRRPAAPTGTSPPTSPAGRCG